MSIICILLFFTICIFSSAMSANLFTARQLQESLPCDLMITKTMELPEDVGFDEGAIARSRLGILEELEKNGFDRTRLTNAMEVRFYVVGGEEEIRLRDTMNASTQAWLQENYPTVTLDALEMFMEVSDYNRLARLFHNEEIALQEDTYAIVADTDVWIQLLAQPVDVDGQRVVIDEGIAVPHVLHQLLSGDDRIFVLKETVHDPQLVLGEIDTVSPVGEHALGDVHGHLAHLHVVGVLGLIDPLQHPGDPRQQDLQVVGLGHIVIRPQVHALQFIDL